MSSPGDTIQSQGIDHDDVASQTQGNAGSKPATITKKVNEKRAWLAYEEEALSAVLKSAIASGLKAENGWKANYKTYLKTELGKLLPGTDIMYQPHIMSKMKQWGREYACVSHIKNLSGSAWNSVEKRMDCSQEFWNSHAQAYPGMMKKKNTKWPLFDDWEIIFGKDRANGQGATDIAEAAKRFIPDIINNANKKKGLAEDFATDGDGWLEGEDGATSTHVAKKSKASTATAAKPDHEVFVAAISNIFSQERVITDSTHVLRAQVNGALVPLGLSTKDRLAVGRILSNNDKLLHYFFSLRAEDREAIVREELENVVLYRPGWE